RWSGDRGREARYGQGRRRHIYARVEHVERDIARRQLLTKTTALQGEAGKQLDGPHHAAQHRRPRHPGVAQGVGGGVACLEIAATRQWFAHLARAFARHVIASLCVCGNRQQPRVWVSVSRSTAGRASAVRRARSGTPSATHARCPPPAAGTDPYASSPPETTGSGP